ncbi:MAG: RagB/SusD family nutrient uptake outer membrane protein, partial [Bacteroidales bacterium]|nr:RagB/SusD family nutrient uptake outer membrane protein [Bacteroidales bacterium]
DARLLSDFQYLSSCPFRLSRGFYHFSSYRYKRLDQYLHTWTEPMPEMRKAENDLMLAEAKLMIGDKAGAIAIINAGTRISRGGLALIANDASISKVASAITYERTIELYLSGFGIPFFDMRRMDMLQIGTPLHFPIPQQQLDIMLMENYTFGGILNADGIGTSIGGWNSKKRNQG